MIAWTNCVGNFKPDLVDWQTETWVLSGFSETEDSLEKICSSRPPGRILQPNTAFFHSGQHTCNMFNSDMGVCDSRDTDLAMKEYFDSSQGERCRADPSDLSKYYYWCGYTDQRTEDVWLDVNTGKELARPDRLWWKAQPNGREHQNCMEATYYSSLNNTPTQWNDNYCNTSKGRLHYIHLGKSLDQVLVSSFSGGQKGNIMSPSESVTSVYSPLCPPSS